MNPPEGKRSLNYVLEKFYVAVLTLASGSGSVQQRLADAYLSSLIRLEVDDLPDDMREDFIILEEALTRTKPVGDEGLVMASIATMSVDEAQRLAEAVVDLYGRIAERDPLRHYHTSFSDKLHI